MLGFVPQPNLQLFNFYLNHQKEIEEYLEQRQQQAQEIRKINEARFDPQGLRDRLLA